MQKPVWLLSMDSDQFPAAPMTTGALTAYYRKFGRYSDTTHIELVHFVNRPQHIARWLEAWKATELPVAEQALAARLMPVMAFSVYTWNAAEFLQLMHDVKTACPGITIVAGGPHVQQAQDYLFSEAVDVVILGEGEITFTEFLDTNDRSEWKNIRGMAFVEKGEMVKTPSRPRIDNLDSLPSALDVISLTDSTGQPYDCIAYETSRGCPYKCSFCEWGTGAIGTKMHSYSVERIRNDWERIIAAGIRNLWLCDSNFGALKQDIDKARILCELKQRTGLPYSFATSWSKKHSPKVQEIVLMMHENKLLPHYHLALQTLTPLALELCHRENMAANQYEPIAKKMAKARIPIACELIWGLIGDNLTDFEKNLDRLFAVFPTINIFGYTLLPGTEFYEKREEYRIETLPVAGYGKAKGEYVVGCFTFPVEEGLEGYFLITAHLLLSRGYLLPLTLRYLALSGKVPVAPMMRAILRELVSAYHEEIPTLDVRDKMGIYEQREEMFVSLLTHHEKTYALFAKVVYQWLQQHRQTALWDNIQHMLALDATFSPKTGATRTVQHCFDFDANAVMDILESMELPGDELFLPKTTTVAVFVPGGVGDIIKDPDGGVWIHSERADNKPADKPVLANAVGIPVVELINA